MRLLLRALLLALWFTAPPLRAQDVLPVPPLSARVIDQTATLSEPQRAALDAKLAAFEAQAGAQIVVLLVPATAPEDIASYAQRLGDAWKIGRRDVGDGLLVVVAKNDRRIWIATSKALEGAVPDLAARQIIERQITPAFRNGDFAGGLNAGVDALMARIRGESLPAPSSQSRARQPGNEGMQWDELLIFALVGLPIVGSVLKGVMGRKLGTVATAAGAGALAFWFTASVLLAAGAALMALFLVGLMGGGGRRGGAIPPIIWGGGGHGGGWGGGGGGFSSGGGGDFGGGGAGGSW